MRPHPAKRGFQQRCINHPALARGVAPFNRGQNANHRPHAGAQIKDLHTASCRRPAFRAIHHHQARIALQDRLIARMQSLRPHRAKSTKRGINQPRKTRGQRRTTQPQILQSAGAHVLHDHIRLTQQFHQQSAVGIIAEIKAERFLAAIDGDEGGGGAFMHGRPPAARIITTFGAFQLDHLAPQHGEDLACKRPRQILRDFDNPDTGQR